MDGIEKKASYYAWIFFVQCLVSCLRFYVWCGARKNVLRLPMSMCSKFQTNYQFGKWVLRHSQKVFQLMIGSPLYRRGREDEILDFSPPRMCVRGGERRKKGGEWRTRFVVCPNRPFFEWSKACNDSEHVTNLKASINSISVNQTGLSLCTFSIYTAVLLSI